MSVKIRKSRTVFPTPEELQKKHDDAGEPDPVKLEKSRQVIAEMLKEYPVKTVFTLGANEEGYPENNKAFDIIKDELHLAGWSMSRTYHPHPIGHGWELTIMIKE